MLNETKIREAGKKAGICLMGFTDVAPLSECLPWLEERKREKGVTSFERVKPAVRIDYKKAYAEAEGVIVIGVPYYQKIKKPQSMKNRGRIASVAWGKDYHEVVKAKLNGLGTCLLKENEGFDYRIYVDNSRLVDRGTAWRAGLGFFGKNNTLINSRYGSFFFIGLMLINQKIDFKKTAPLESQCGNCMRCLKACPNQALETGYTLVPERCISYLTQKKKLTDDEEKLLGDFIYGCDDCQSVCPYNKDLEDCKDFKTEPEWVYPILDEIMHMDDKHFKERFIKTAAGWRGKEILKRNARLIKNK